MGTHLTPAQMAQVREIIAADRSSRPNLDQVVDVIEGTIVDHGPVHMPAEDYARGAGNALVPARRPGAGYLPATQGTATTDGPIVVNIIQPSAADAVAKWSPGSVIAVGVLGLAAAAVAVAAVIVLAPVAVAVAAAVIFLIRALRPSPPPSAPEPTKKRRRWGR